MTAKNIFYLITVGLIISTFAFSSKREQRESIEDLTFLKREINPGNLLTISDAEKIIGEPAHLTDSVSLFKENSSAFKCSYTANSEDEKTGKKGAVYFLFEQYSQVSSAQKKYSFIKKSNENHEGVKVLHDMGDEAYFHSDEQNFYFIMVRKGDKIFNMKVNKITSMTSLIEFNLIAKKITAAL